MNHLKIGCDIIEFASFPEYNNANKRFFQDNFTPKEISWSTNSLAPKEEFAKIFSIKESLVKADNTLLNVNFNNIQISCKADYCYFKDFSINFSKTNKMCITTVISI